MTNQIHKEPLLRLVKRTETNKIRVIITYAISIASSIIIASLLLAVLAGTSPFKVFSSLFEGNFGTKRRIWILIKDFALLVGVSLAIVLAFRMKFWNLGGNGQILVGGLAAMACMHYLGLKAGWSSIAIMPVMIIASLLAGAIWGVIPAIFKAYFKTNESLFTLMMNYIAIKLVEICIAVWDESGSHHLQQSFYTKFGLPQLINQHFLIILTIAILTVVGIIYLKKTKQGYEISVVGESERTAKYVGINQKAVIIRTMVLSGAICGLVGMLIVGAQAHNITTATDNNMGFTSIMTVWLAQCNPVTMLGTCFLVVFLTKGMEQASQNVGITDNAVVSLVIGIVYFIIIATKFFIDYKIVFRKKQKVVATEGAGVKQAATNSEITTNNQEPKEDTAGSGDPNEDTLKQDTKDENVTDKEEQK